VPIFLIEAVAQYRMVYCVDADTAAQAQSCVTQGHVPQELAQKYLGEQIIDVRQVEQSEILRVHDELNPWRDTWSTEQKLTDVFVCETPHDM
jgi:hypothetical protein